jgi:hypothetical protein
MKNTTTLLVINCDTPDNLIAEHAEAARASDIHLQCLMLWSAPALPLFAYGTPPYGGMNIPDNWGETLNAVRKDLTTREAEIEAVIARSGASAQRGISADSFPSVCNHRHQKHRRASPPLSGMLSAALFFSNFQVGGLGQ